MQYPPLNASFSCPLLLEQSLQQAHKAEGEPKPQKLKIDQVVWEGAVAGGSTYRPLAPVHVWRLSSYESKQGKMKFKY